MLVVPYALWSFGLARVSMSTRSMWTPTPVYMFVMGVGSTRTWMCNKAKNAKFSVLGL